jgi:hypothetical protein
LYAAIQYATSLRYPRASAMKYVESAWSMLRPGITVANSTICAGQAVFGCGGTTHIGLRHHDSLAFPFAFGRGRQRSSKNALAGCAAVNAMSRQPATKLERDFMRTPPPLR